MALRGQYVPVSASEEEWEEDATTESSRFLSSAHPDHPDGIELLSHSPVGKSTEDREKDNEDDDASAQSPYDPPSSDNPGALAMQAQSLTWSPTILIVAYVLMWLTFFVQGLLSGTAAVLTPYVTSSFALHSLTPAVGILSSVIAGVTNLTLAKVLDVFGRPQGYLFCIILAVVGLTATAISGGIESYAVAQVFQTVGTTGIIYSLGVLVADTSSLRNQGLLQALVASPNMITCWLAGPIASWFLEGMGWRWAFGLSSVLVLAVTLPLFGLLMHGHIRAKEKGQMASTDATFGQGGRERVSRSWKQSLLHHLRQFDAVGLVLLSAGVASVLFSLNLFPMLGWRSPLVISLFLTGIVLIALFGVWERRYATVSFLPFSLLLDRTALGACILSATLFLSYFCWSSFFSSYLQVVHDLSVTDTNYVVQSYTVGSLASAMLVGYLIQRTGRFRSVGLYGGVLLIVLGTVMMLYFSSVQSSIVYIVLSQVVISVAAGTIMVCAEVAIFAAAGSRQRAAVCLAVLGLFGSMGGAVSLTISSTLWQEVFPQKLKQYLPSEKLPELQSIYADISTQMSYPVGSETRLAIQHAYSDTQTRMLAVSVGVWVLGLLGVLLWRDINVIGIHKNKGYGW